MTLHEPITAPDGFRLVHGSFVSCRRDVTRPAGWRGLSGGDAALLLKWLSARDASRVELYTDVECGVCVDLDGTVNPVWVQTMAARCSALRIDVVVREGGGWSLVELKPSAGYIALGQLLTYAYYAGHRAECLVDAELVVVTDFVQEVVRPVYALHGVRVDEVGDVDL